MTSTLIFEPYLGEWLSASESRSHAFIAKNYGVMSRPSAVAVRLVGPPTRPRTLLLEVLVGLLVRMEPVVAAVVVEADAATLAGLESTLLARYPVRVKQGRLTSNASIGIGGGPGQFVDADGWEFSCDVVLPQSEQSNPVGPFLGALEAAKLIFATAVTFGCERALFDVRWTPGVFDSWGWKWNADSTKSGPLELPVLDAVVAGCGGVAAGYLWLAAKLPKAGKLALIDDDTIEAHNLNRLFFASLVEARAELFKVDVAASLMKGLGWDVEPVPRRVEHSDSMNLLAKAKARGAVLLSMVGEPMTRRTLQNRDFSSLIDAATNSDGSIRVIGVGSESACLKCYLFTPAAPRVQAGCGQMSTSAFAGVVPHLSGGAGFIACVEHLKVGLGAPLRGVNVQSIVRSLSAADRERVPRSSACPDHV